MKNQKINAEELIWASLVGEIEIIKEQETKKGVQNG